MDSLRISEIELELSLLKMKIKSAKLELMNPTLPSSRKQEMERELRDLDAKVEALTQELNTLRRSRGK